MSETAQKDLEGKLVPKATCSVETAHKYVWTTGNFRVSVSESGYDSLIEKLEKKKSEGERAKLLIEWVDKKIKVVRPEATVSTKEWVDVVKELSAAVNEGPVMTQADIE